MTAAEWADRAGAFERRMMRWAVKQLGRPYIWGGKGDLRFDVKQGLRPWTKAELTPGSRAYDCGGLITSAARETTAIDVRGMWNAQSLLDATRQHESAGVLYRTLRFYGRSRADVVHVAFGDESRSPWPMAALVLEAAGAGSDAVDETKARALGAEVRLVDDRRSDYLCSVPLWALGVALGALPPPPVAP